MIRMVRNAPSFVVEHRRVILAAWALVAMAMIPFARGAQRRLETGTRVPGSESARAEELLSTRLASPFAKHAVLVVRGVPSPMTDGGRAVLERIVDRLMVVQPVAATFSALDLRDTLFAANGGTFVIAGLDAPETPTDSILPLLRTTTAALQAELRAEYPNAELLWTGELALTVDLRRSSADDANRAERRVLPLTLILLAVAFGALTAAAIPVAIGALAITVTMGVVALIARVMPVSILVLNVATMLGLGLGIDYALLLVSRFRESRRRGDGAAAAAVEAAAVEAAKYAGHSIVLSGTAVMVGFLALLLVPLPDLRSIAIGGAVVTTVCVLLATTLLPGALAMIGDRVDSGRMRAAPLGSSDRSGFWTRWSGWIVRRPLLALSLAGLPTLALAWQWRGLHTRTPDGDWLPPSVESARGLHALEDMGRSGVVYGIRMILELPAEGESRFTSLSVRPLAEQLRHTPGAARVIPGAVSADGRFTLLEILPSESRGVAHAMALVRELRRVDPAALTGVPGTRLAVGGLPAFNVDYGDAIAWATPRVIALVVAGTFIALMIGFRSMLVPVKAIALNLLSVGAAFGAVVLVFQRGFGSRAFGLAAPLDGIFPAVPLLVFCIVFGLSMDYEVFLVSRVAEASRAGRGDGESVIEGVTKTGGVITNAAIVMIVVFGAFTMGEFVFMKILGFALAVAVLLDVTVIRLALGPALLRLAGRWNWWPREPATATRTSGALQGRLIHTV